MTLTQSSIYIGLARLRKKMFGAMYTMDKGARIIYGTPIMQEIGKALAYFTLAYTVKDKRAEYIDECVGHYTVARIDIQFCFDENLFKFKKHSAKIDDQTEAMEINPQKVELAKLIAMIDNDISKYQVSSRKGKTLTDDKT